MSSGGDLYLDPEPSSLYNVLTLKQLIALGETSVNLMVEKDTTYTDAIAANLTDWITISNTLGFCTS
jgi:hypothetical protein